MLDPAATVLFFSTALDPDPDQRPVFATVERAALCRHKSGVVLFCGIALAPLPLGEARRLFRPHLNSTGSRRQFLAESEAIERLVSAINRRAARPWLKLAASLAASVAPLLHVPAVRAALLDALAQQRPH